MPTPLFDLAGKVALVTGGNKGLGKAMARVFAEAGADIVICSRHAAELDRALPELLAGTGVRGRSFVIDMTDRTEVALLAKSAMDAMGRVDIFVKNAGSNIPQVIDEIDDEKWDRIVELNLTSCISLSRALIPQMKQRRCGRIIQISSVMGLTSKSGRGCYSATKSALIGLARAMAFDLGPFGITCNCIAPGPFLTDLSASVLNREEQDSFAERTALGRWADPRKPGDRRNC